MSWFYEALLRTEEKQAGTEKGVGPSIADRDGDSFLKAMESLTAVAAPPRRTQAPLPSTAVETPALKEVGAEEVRGDGFRRVSSVLREEARLVFHSDPMGNAAEQFRLLRRRLSQDFPRGAVIMITSPAAGDGKTMTALNLAACLADSGDATLFVEGDLRRPTASKILGCAVEPPGLEYALLGVEEPHKVVHFVENLSLHAALVTTVPKDPSHLLTGNGIKNFLAWAHRRFSWIVIDTAPVLPSADVSDLLPKVEAALLVVRAQITPTELSKRAIEMLGKHLHGVIWNDATIHSAPYYRYMSDYHQLGKKN